MKSAFAFILMGVSCVASAADTVSIPHVTPYIDGVGTEAIRQKCDWNSKLSEKIVHYAETPVRLTEQDPSTIPGKVLFMRIVNVHAIGGGSFTGPKFATVRGELRENGKVIGSFEEVEYSTVGMTVCGSLDHLAKEMADNIADWLKDPVMNARP